MLRGLREALVVCLRTFRSKESPTPSSNVLRTAPRPDLPASSAHVVMGGISLGEQERHLLPEAWEQEAILTAFTQGKTVFAHRHGSEEPVVEVQE